jgi:hypothetical protein
LAFFIYSNQANSSLGFGYGYGIILEAIINYLFDTVLFIFTTITIFSKNTSRYLKFSNIFLLGFAPIPIIPYLITYIIDILKKEPAGNNASDIFFLFLFQPILTSILLAIYLYQDSKKSKSNLIKNV